MWKTFCYGHPPLCDSQVACLTESRVCQWQESWQSFHVEVWFVTIMSVRCDTDTDSVSLSWSTNITWLWSVMHYPGLIGRMAATVATIYRVFKKEGVKNIYLYLQNYLNHKNIWYIPESLRTGHLRWCVFLAYFYLFVSFINQVSFSDYFPKPSSCKAQQCS